MQKFKNYLHHIFIDGLSGMALGLFSTLIIGTILQQIGNLISGNLGSTIFLIGKIAAAATCAGIGVGVAYKFKETPLVVISAAVSGMVGGFATKLLAGSIMTDTGVITLAGPGEPLGAFIAALVGIEIGHLIAGKTKIDIIITPLVCIGAGSTVGLLLSPPISDLAWNNNYVCNGTTTFYNGNACFCNYGYIIDFTNKFCCNWCNIKFRWNYSRSCCYWLLLSNGWICCGKL